MSVRKTALILALAALGGLSAAHADSIFVGGEMGWVDRPVQSTLTSEAVRQEFLAFRRNPVAPDGGQFVGGEAGYIFPRQITHNPKPSLNKTDAERRLFLEQYSPA